MVRLIQYAERMGGTAVVKRLGWALERLDAPREAVEPLRAYPAKGDAASIPAANRAGGTTPPGASSKT